MDKVNFLSVFSDLSGKFSSVFLNIWSDIFWVFFQKTDKHLLKLAAVFLKLLKMQIKFLCQKIFSVTTESRPLLLLKKLALREIPLMYGQIPAILSSRHVTMVLIRRTCLRTVSVI